MVMYPDSHDVLLETVRWMRCLGIGKSFQYNSLVVQTRIFIISLKWPLTIHATNIYTPRNFFVYLVRLVRSFTDHFAVVVRVPVSVPWSFHGLRCVLMCLSDNGFAVYLFVSPIKTLECARAVRNEFLTRRVHLP